MDAATTPTAELTAPPTTTTTPTALDSTTAPPTLAIGLEATPEFQAWKQAKLNEVLIYLQDNWQLNIGIDQLVMAPQYVFPDRKNRRAYASVSSGQSFRDENGAIVINPETNQPMTFTVWRKVEPPAQPPATATDPTIEDTKPDIEPVEAV